MDLSASLLHLVNERAFVSRADSEVTSSMKPFFDSGLQLPPFCSQYPTGIPFLVSDPC